MFVFLLPRRRIPWTALCWRENRRLNCWPALREQDLPELAAEIAPDWDLPTEAVQSGLETLRSHLELVQGDAALLYEMT